MNATVHGEDLLRKYVQGDEGAFEALVRRYVDLVFAAALRQSNGDIHLAEDITQVVFADLARQAAKLPRGTFLGGWLFRHTQYVASTLRRSKQRRERREAAAACMSDSEVANENETWREIAPVLDEAMNALPEPDRNALILRFFEGLSLREVAATLGTTEEAGRERIARALENLRGLLSRKGVTSSTASLVVLLGSHAVVTAPAGLANVIASTVALSSGATAAAAPILEGIIMSKVKIGVASALAAAAIVTPVWQHQEIRERDLELAELRRQVEEMAKVHSAIAALPTIEQDENELARLREQHAELMRLRGIVTAQSRDLEALRQRAARAEAAAEEENVRRRLAESRNMQPGQATSTIIDPQFVPGEYRVADLRWTGSATPIDTAQSVLYAIFQNDPESLASLQFFPNSPEGLGEQEELRLAQERVAELRRVWAGVQGIKKLGFAHVRDDKYTAVFSFDYGPTGRPEGAPAGGDITLKKIGAEFRVVGYGWRQHD